MKPPRSLDLLSIVLLVYCTFASPVERALSDATASVFALFYLGLTLIALPMLRGATNGPSLLAFLFLTVWAGDTVAMYAGRAFGKRKMAPNLSPQLRPGREPSAQWWVRSWWRESCLH